MPPTINFFEAQHLRMRIILVYNNAVNIINNVWNIYMPLVSLDKLKKGERGVIRKIDESLLPQKIGLADGEIEMRLLEMGFIEGAYIKVLHLGAIFHDPIAVRINNTPSVIALRKNEASILMLEKINE